MQKSPLRVTIEHQGTAFSITRTKSKRVGKLIISSRSNTFSERYGMGVWWESQRAAQTCYPEALMETYHVIGGAGSLRSSMSSIMKRGWTFGDIKISWNSDDFQRVGSLVIFFRLSVCEFALGTMSEGDFEKTLSAYSRFKICELQSFHLEILKKGFRLITKLYS